MSAQHIACSLRQVRQLIVSGAVRQPRSRNRWNWAYCRRSNLTRKPTAMPGAWDQRGSHAFAGQRLPLPAVVLCCQAMRHIEMDWAWRQRAKHDAILDSCARSMPSVRSGIMTYVAFVGAPCDSACCLFAAFVIRAHLLHRKVCTSTKFL